MNAPILANEFDVSKITYGTPMTGDSGAKHIRLSYKRAPLTVQTPDMHAPFGHSSYENNNKFSIQLAFKDMADRPELKEFYDMLMALDKKIVEDAFSGVLPTHNKKFTSIDVVEILYKPQIKASKDDKYPANFKVNMPTGDKGEFTFPTYVLDPKTHKPELADLKETETKGAVCTMIMQCVGIWVAGGSTFGCTWKATQLRVQPTVSKTDYAFKEVNGSAFAVAEADLDEKAEDVPQGDEDKENEDGGDENDENENEENENEENEEEDIMETPVAAAKAKAAAKPRAKAAAK